MSVCADELGSAVLSTSTSRNRFLVAYLLAFQYKMILLYNEMMGGESDPLFFMSTGCLSLIATAPSMWLWLRLHAKQAVFV